MPSRKKSSGLGDTIEKITEATGIKKAVKAIVGEDCGCDERKEKLNKLFPYAKPFDEEARELYEENFLGWKDWARVPAEKQHLMLQMLRDFGGVRHKMSRCGSCVKRNLASLEQIYLNSCES